MSMRSVYRKVARKNGVSMKEVKEEMQKAIDSAWDSPNRTGQNIVMQNLIKPDGSKPTVEEVISFASNRVKKER